MAFDLDQAVAKVEERLANTEETTAWPVLIMLCGLPATGKSYLARRLVERVPFVIVETDFVRKALFRADIDRRPAKFTSLNILLI